MVKAQAFQLGDQITPVTPAEPASNTISFQGKEIKPVEFKASKAKESDQPRRIIRPRAPRPQLNFDPGEEDYAQGHGPRGRAGSLEDYEDEGGPLRQSISKSVRKAVPSSPGFQDYLTPGNIMLGFLVVGSLFLLGRTPVAPVAAAPTPNFNMATTRFRNV